MEIFLEVIVTSAEEARLAEAGGADRLELVSALEVGGLTPSSQTVEAVLRSVKVPIRVMVRERPTMTIDSAADRQRLLQAAAQFSSLGVNGLVTGFLNQGGVDPVAMEDVAAAAHGASLTFHRAFDDVANRASAVSAVKSIPQVDRVLTAGADGTLAERFKGALELQDALGSQIRVLWAAGLEVDRLKDLDGFAASANRLEVHIGRAARSPQSVGGAVDPARIEALRRLL